MRPDPYAADKPRLVITGKNADEFKGQLTAVTYALLKRYPTMRVDVYPTRRPVVYPEEDPGEHRKECDAGQDDGRWHRPRERFARLPVPDPEDRQRGDVESPDALPGRCDDVQIRFVQYRLFRHRNVVHHRQSATRSFRIFAPANIDKPLTGKDAFWLIKQEYTGPARRAGEALIIYDHVSPLAQPRKAWQYLPGQRRVKLAPEIAYDTPNPGVAGASTYDDAFVFNGAMDRYDFKLVGKREMIIPYNDYKAVYFPGGKANVTTPNHFNPDLVRWELHRVWVVEATLKPGKRHIYQKRTFYIDEDSWVAAASDNYDARGQLYRGMFAFTAFAYDAQALPITLQNGYDLVGGQYSSQGNCGLYTGIKFRDPFPRARLDAGRAGGRRHSLNGNGMAGASTAPAMPT